MSKKLPLKARVLQYAIEGDTAFSIETLKKDMAKEYPGERFINDKFLERMILSFCGVKVMEPVDLGYDEKGEPIIGYRITNFGKNYKKMLPGSPEYEKAKFFQF